MKAIAKKG